MDKDNHRRFEDACEAIKRNAAKLLVSEEVDSCSTSDDEVDEHDLTVKTFYNYSAEADGDLVAAKEQVHDILSIGGVVCLICIDSVKKKQPIWHCENCYCILHLVCIRKWAKDSLHVSSVDIHAEFKKWCCPKCRWDYPEAQKTLEYTCFCGKTENPTFTEWRLPHSCGKTCSNTFKPDCGHYCSLLCHPGPCPPCPQSVYSSCCCGKSELISLRCSKREWTCGKMCHKLLKCEIHKCEKYCHTGDCHSCTKLRDTKCDCGSEVALKPCCDNSWKCKKVCLKLLECGNHTCRLICHKGPCPACPNSGERLCPCGKSQLVLPCTEDVLPCGDTCGKLLDCEVHLCTQRCHNGSCEECHQMRLMKCKCGQREKHMPCCKEFTCEIKCKLKRDCGKHNCNKKCCIGNCPPCRLLCGKTLNCGRHKCSSVCHSGPCYPCLEMIELACNCGKTKRIVPCGQNKSTVPPRCAEDCRLPADCHHANRHKHKCHFGSCPACRLKCGMTLACGHTCPTKCHSAILTKVDTNKKKDGPWDLKEFKMEFVSKPCPPCLVPCLVMCFAKHETASIACFEAKPFSCGRICGNLLICENHTCQRVCHYLEKVDNELQNDCNECFSACLKPRKEGCTHSCSMPCHPRECPPCKHVLKLACHCNITIMTLICDEWTNLEELNRTEFLSCKTRCSKEIPCGHQCMLLCHPGHCTKVDECKKKVKIYCQCKRKKKEVQCFLLRNTKPLIQCDEKCIEEEKLVLLLKEEQRAKIEAEEKLNQEKELEMFLKKSAGRKKKKKIIENVEQTYSFKSKFVIFSVVVCVLGMLFYFKGNIL